MALKDIVDEQAMRGSADLIIPLHEEALVVERRERASGTVRVELRTRTHEQTIEEMLSRERVDVERVAIGRPIDAVPDIRQEGDVTIIPVVEEVLVIERRLVLKEEIRLHRVRTNEPYRQTATLRVQEAEISRQATTPAGRDVEALTPNSKEHHDE